MTGRIRPVGLVTLATAALALGLTACGSSKSSTTSSSGGAAATPSSSSSSSTTSASSSSSGYKVGLVTDIGGLNDRSFNHLAFLGLQEAESQLGIQGRVLESHSQSDYVPNLTSLARAGDNLVIAVGFLMEAAVKQVATAFPKTDFIIIDDSVANIGKLPNEEGMLFHTEQSGYLVGYLAGLYAKAHHYKVVSSVGGQKLPSVDSYIAGYQAGAKAADPGITTLNAYSQDFVAQDKCKTIALNQIASGSKVVFQVAGGCGLGALSAAQEKGDQGIGVDADQSFLGSYILSSAVKKIDKAVVLAIQAAKSGNFKGNTDLQNSLSNGGTGYGKIGPAGTPYASAVANVAKEILSGKISNIPTTVK